MSNRFFKWALIALLGAFLMWNPLTRKLIFFLLPTGRAVDDLIEAALLVTAALLFLSGSARSLAIQKGSAMKRFLRRFLPIVAVMVLPLSASACYFNHVVDPNKVAVRTDGGKISEVAGPGMYSGGLFADIVDIDTSSKTSIWTDPDLVTSDKQPIGLTLGLTYARKSDADSVRLMYEKYNAEAKDDAALANLVANRVPRIAKTVTAKYTLNEMLGIEGSTKAASAVGREVITNEILTLLKPELAEFGVDLLDVGVNNIAPDGQYLNALKAKAAAQIGVEVAAEETKKLKEVLLQERSQTEIDIEKARRANLVNSELAKTYEQSPQYYELERLKIVAGIYGGKDKIIIVPAGTDPNIFLGASGIVPVPGE